jgi:hypothetical protein
LEIENAAMDLKLVLLLFPLAAFISFGAPSTNPVPPRSLESALKAEIAKRLPAKLTTSTIPGDQLWWTSWNAPATNWSGIGGAVNGVRTNSWIYGVEGLESMAVYRSAADGITGLPCLVSPQHFITSTHTGYALGEMLVWNGVDGRRYTNYVMAKLMTNDFQVVILSNALPAAVPRLPVAHESLTNQLINCPWIFAGRFGELGSYRFAIPVMNPTNWYPATHMNGAYLLSHVHSSGTAPYRSGTNDWFQDRFWRGSVYGQWTNRSGKVFNFKGSAIGGDSASPGWILCENRLIWCGNVGLNACDYRPSWWIKQAMDTLSDGHHQPRQPLKVFKWNDHPVWDVMP